MGRQDDLPSKLERHRADYVLVREAPFEFFFCPILLEDSSTELCLGHVINKSFQNTNRQTVVQRKDVDSFYGSLVEDAFGKLIAGKKLGAWNVLQDKDLARQLRPKIHVDGQAVEHYVATKDGRGQHPVLKMSNNQGEFFDIALKVPADLNLEAAQVELVMEADYLPDVTAALLKSAHLTLFSLLGYQYVFSSTGYYLAKILQKFFLDNRELPRNEKLQNVRDYFVPPSGMIAPLEKFSPGTLRGTLADRRILACVGSSGKYFSIVIVLKLDQEMHLVFLPTNDPECADTYDSFVRDEKSEFMVKIFEHKRAKGNRPACWVSDGSAPIRMKLAPWHQID